MPNPEEQNPAALPVVKAGDYLSVVDLMQRPQQIWDLLPEPLAGLTHTDAEYHYRQRHNWIELNQVDAPRNLAIHQQVVDLVGEVVRPGAVLLEMGGGIAFDAQKILTRRYPLRCYLFSEISIPLLDYVAGELDSPNGTTLVYCALDACHLRIANDQVDIVLMIAALHHVSDLEQALAEISRISKPDARIIFGIEPNRMYGKWLARLRKFFRPLFPQKSHSAADEENEGFSVQDFRNIARQTGWRLEGLRPVWLTCGFLHYGLEFLYRVLRLEKRIRLPVALEDIFISLDECLLRIAALHPLAWHYTVSYRKNE